MYPHPGFAISRPAALLSAFVILGLSVLAVIFRRRRLLFVGWFWFLGTLLPMSGAVVQAGPHSMADRYAYIPLLGIFVIVCWGAADLMQRLHAPTAVWATASAAILLTLGIALHRQLSFWSDNVTLWTHTLNITKDNFIAEEDLAMALISQGKAKDALPHFQRAHFLRPNDPLASLNIATYDQMLGHYEAALDGYAMVIRSNLAAPSLLATACANSGYAHLSLKQYDDAKKDFEAALRAQPDQFGGLSRAGPAGTAIWRYRPGIPETTNAPSNFSPRPSVICFSAMRSKSADSQRLHARQNCRPRA